MSGRMRLQFLILSVLVLAIPLPCAAAEDTTKAKDPIRQTLLYGIDSQVLETVQKLKASGDVGYAKELAAILAEPRTPDVLKAILDLFEAQKAGEGEDAAKEMIAAWQEESADLVSAAIRYLSAIGSAGLSPRLLPLVDAADGGVASAAIRALGRTGDPSNTALLAAKLRSAEFPEARKPDLILAFGDLKDPSAVELLLGVVKNRDEDKVRRMYAADSLGRIGDTRALPALKALFEEKDALLRAYAASALAQFALDDVFPLLVQGLKDENAKVRQQCAKSLGKPLSVIQAEAALPVLVYKAEQDPVGQVRLEAIRTLGEIGGEGASAFLVKLCAEATSPFESREAALGVIAQKAFPAGLDAIRTIVETEWKAADQRALESTARILSTAKWGSLKDVYLRLLECTNPVVRSYAVRGIAENGFGDLKDSLRQISSQDPNPAVRKEAERALGRL